METNSLPSRTEIKKQMHALQDLANAIVTLTEGQLASIPLDGELKEAVAAARRIKSREGRRRQLHYVGKLMRNSDTEAIRDAYQALLDGRNAAARSFHALEKLRDEMVEKGPDTIGSFAETYPHTDRQHLRQLILAAQKEKALDKPPANSRKLFRYLRELTESG